MSLTFYELGSSPPRVDNVTFDLILQRERREELEFFLSLERLLDKPWLRWGAVGIITASDPRSERYVWHYKPRRDPELARFIEDVESYPDEYLLIGNLAAHQFRCGAPPKCILLTNGECPDRSDILCARWDEPGLLRRFLGSEVPKYEQLETQWERYVTRVRAVTRGHRDALIYVPVIAQRPLGSREQMILAGGLVWCVDRERVPEALANLDEAQLFLRWQLSELFGRNPLLGLANDFIDVDHLIRDKGWFNDGEFISKRTTVPHKFVDFDDRKKWVPGCDREGMLERAKVDIETALNWKLTRFDEVVHAAMKQLYADNVSMASLYLIGTVALQRKLGVPAIISMSALRNQADLPIRAKVGRRPIARHVRSNFFQFITATAKSERDDSRLLERIDVRERHLTVTYADPELAQRIAEKLDRIFSGNDRTEKPHSSSGPLSEFIMWSGSDFRAEDCRETHANLCVTLTQCGNGGQPKSVLRIESPSLRNEALHG